MSGSVNCRRASKLLPLHAGGDLEPAIAAAVDVHLASCPPCAREAHSYQRALADLRAHGATAQPAASGPRLWESLEPRLAAVDALRRTPWYRRTGFVSAAAAVLLVSVAGPLFLAQQGGPSGHPGAHPAGTQRMGAAGPALAADSPGAIPAGWKPVPSEDLQRLAYRGYVRPNSTGSAPGTGSPVIQAGNSRGQF